MAESSSSSESDSDCEGWEVDDNGVLFAVGMKRSNAGELPGEPQKKKARNKGPFAATKTGKEAKAETEEEEENEGDGEGDDSDGEGDDSDQDMLLASLASRRTAAGAGAGAAPAAAAGAGAGSGSGSGSGSETKREEPTEGPDIADALDEAQSFVSIFGYALKTAKDMGKDHWKIEAPFSFADAEYMDLGPPGTSRRLNPLQLAKMIVPGRVCTFSSNNALIGYFPGLAEDVKSQVAAGQLIAYFKQNADEWRFFRFAALLQQLEDAYGRLPLFNKEKRDKYLLAKNGSKLSRTDNLRSALYTGLGTATTQWEYLVALCFTPDVRALADAKGEPFIAPQDATEINDGFQMLQKALYNWTKATDQRGLFNELKKIITTSSSDQKQILVELLESGTTPDRINDRLYAFFAAFFKADVAGKQDQQSTTRFVWYLKLYARDARETAEQLVALLKQEKETRNSVIYEHFQICRKILVAPATEEKKEEKAARMRDDKAALDQDADTLLDSIFDNVAVLRFDAGTRADWRSKNGMDSSKRMMYLRPVDTNSGVDEEDAPRQHKRRTLTLLPVVSEAKEFVDDDDDDTSERRSSEIVGLKKRLDGALVMKRNVKERAITERDIVIAAICSGNVFYAARVIPERGDPCIMLEFRIRESLETSISWFRIGILRSVDLAARCHAAQIMYRKDDIVYRQLTVGDIVADVLNTDNNDVGPAARICSLLEISTRMSPAQVTAHALYSTGIFMDYRVAAIVSACTQQVYYMARIDPPVLSDMVLQRIDAIADAKHAADPLAQLRVELLRTRKSIAHDFWGATAGKPVTRAQIAAAVEELKIEPRALKAVRDELVLNLRSPQMSREDAKAALTSLSAALEARELDEDAQKVAGFADSLIEPYITIGEQDQSAIIKCVRLILGGGGNVLVKAHQDIEQLLQNVQTPGAANIVSLILRAASKQLRAPEVLRERTLEMKIQADKVDEFKEPTPEEILQAQRLVLSNTTPGARMKYIKDRFEGRRLPTLDGDDDDDEKEKEAGADADADSDAEMEKVADETEEADDWMQPDEAVQLSDSLFFTAAGDTKQEIADAIIEAVVEAATIDVTKAEDEFFQLARQPLVEASQVPAAFKSMSERSWHYLTSIATAGIYANLLGPQHGMDQMVTASRIRNWGVYSLPFQPSDFRVFNEMAWRLAMLPDSVKVSSSEGLCMTTLVLGRQVRTLLPLFQSPDKKQCVWVRDDRNRLPLDTEELCRRVHLNSIATLQGIENRFKLPVPLLDEFKVDREFCKFVAAGTTKEAEVKASKAFTDSHARVSGLKKVWKRAARAEKAARDAYNDASLHKKGTAEEIPKLKAEHVDALNALTESLENLDEARETHKAEFYKNFDSFKKDVATKSEEREKRSGEPYKRLAEHKETKDWQRVAIAILCGAFRMQTLVEASRAAYAEAQTMEALYAALRSNGTKLVNAVPDGFTAMTETAAVLSRRTVAGEDDSIEPIFMTDTKTNRITLRRDSLHYPPSYEAARLGVVAGNLHDCFDQNAVDNLLVGQGMTRDFLTDATSFLSIFDGDGKQRELFWHDKKTTDAKVVSVADAVWARATQHQQTMAAMIEAEIKLCTAPDAKIMIEKDKWQDYLYKVAHDNVFGGLVCCHSEGERNIRIRNFQREYWGMHSCMLLLGQLTGQTLNGAPMLQMTTSNHVLQQLQPQNITKLPAETLARDIERLLITDAVLYKVTAFARENKELYVVDITDDGNTKDEVEYKVRAEEDSHIIVDIDKNGKVRRFDDEKREFYWVEKGQETEEELEALKIMTDKDKEKEYIVYTPKKTSTAARDEVADELAAAQPLLASSDRMSLLLPPDCKIDADGKVHWSKGFFTRHLSAGSEAAVEYILDILTKTPGELKDQYERRVHHLVHGFVEGAFVNKGDQKQKNEKNAAAVKRLIVHQRQALATLKLELRDLPSDNDQAFEVVSVHVIANLAKLLDRIIFERLSDHSKERAALVQELKTFIVQTGLAHGDQPNAIRMVWKIVEARLPSARRLRRRLNFLRMTDGQAVHESSKVAAQRDNDLKNWARLDEKEKQKKKPLTKAEAAELSRLEDEMSSVSIELDGHEAKSINELEQEVLRDLWDKNSRHMRSGQLAALERKAKKKTKPAAAVDNEGDVQMPAAETKRKPKAKPTAKADKEGDTEMKAADSDVIVIDDSDSDDDNKPPVAVQGAGNNQPARVVQGHGNKLTLVRSKGPSLAAGDTIWYWAPTGLVGRDETRRKATVLMVLDPATVKRHKLLTPLILDTADVMEMATEIWLDALDTENSFRVREVRLIPSQLPEEDIAKMSLSGRLSEDYTATLLRLRRETGVGDDMLARSRRPAAAAGAGAGAGSGAGSGFASMSLGSDTGAGAGSGSGSSSSKKKKKKKSVSGKCPPNDEISIDAGD